jgi:hypothetical protein
MSEMIVKLSKFGMMLFANLPVSIAVSQDSMVIVCSCLRECTHK